MPTKLFIFVAGRGEDQKVRAFFFLSDPELELAVYGNDRYAESSGTRPSVSLAARWNRRSALRLSFRGRYASTPTRSASGRSWGVEARCSRLSSSRTIS